MLALIQSRGQVDREMNVVASLEVNDFRRPHGLDAVLVGLVEVGTTCFQSVRHRAEEVDEVTAHLVVGQHSGDSL